jgi:hypothetical protein
MGAVPLVELDARPTRVAAAPSPAPTTSAPEATDHDDMDDSVADKVALDELERELALELAQASDDDGVVEDDEPAAEDVGHIVFRSTSPPTASSPSTADIDEVEALVEKELERQNVDTTTTTTTATASTATIASSTPASTVVDIATTTTLRSPPPPPPPDNSLLSVSSALTSREPMLVDEWDSCDLTPAFQMRSWLSNSVHPVAPNTVLGSCEALDLASSSSGSAAARTVTSGCIAHLLPNAWFNDEIVNLYLFLLSRRYPRVECLSSFVATRLMTDDGLATVSQWPTVQSAVARFRARLVDTILVPVHMHASRHWVLVAIHARDRSWQLYDSMASPHAVTPYRNALEPWVHALFDHTTTTTTTAAASTTAPLFDDDGTTTAPAAPPHFSFAITAPHQDASIDSSNCGVYICWYAEQVCKLSVPDAIASMGIGIASINQHRDTMLARLIRCTPLCIPSNSQCVAELLIDESASFQAAEQAIQASKTCVAGGDVYAHTADSNATAAAVAATTDVVDGMELSASLSQDAQAQAVSIVDDQDPMLVVEHQPSNATIVDADADADATANEAEANWQLLLAPSERSIDVDAALLVDDPRERDELDALIASEAAVSELRSAVQVVDIDNEDAELERLLATATDVDAPDGDEELSDEEIEKLLASV